MAENVIVLMLVMCGNLILIGIANAVRHTEITAHWVCPNSYFYCFSKMVSSIHIRTFVWSPCLDKYGGFITLLSLQTNPMNYPQPEKVNTDSSRIIFYQHKSLHVAIQENTLIKDSCYTISLRRGQKFCSFYCVSKHKQLIWKCH